MANICDLKSTRKVQERIAELSTHIDSSAATAAIIKNNGYSLDKTPKGKESILYKNLLTYYDGNVDKALSAKSQIYSSNFLENFGDWINNFDIENVDINGEPDIETLNLDAKVFQNANITNYKNSLQQLLQFQLDQLPTDIDKLIAVKVFNQAHNTNFGYYNGITSKKFEVKSVLEFPETTRDKIERKRIWLNEQNLNLLLDYLQNKFPEVKINKLTHQDFVNQAKLHGLKAIPNSYIFNDTVYIDMSVATADILYEEFLHPLVNQLKSQNQNLFDKLYQESLKTFPDLTNEIDVLYSTNKDEELVTQVLSRYLRNEIDKRGKNTRTILNYLEKVLDWIEQTLSDLFGNKESKPVKLQAKDFKEICTFEDLAKIINSKEVSIKASLTDGFRLNTSEIIEDTVGQTNAEKYRSRTKKNAEWSDVTAAFAIDFNTAGEKLTKNAAGDKYIPILLNNDDPTILKTTKEQLDALIEKCKQFSEGVKLNIAGNGLYSLKVPQAQVDDIIYKVIKYLIDNGVKIAEIRSGGQTGVDEAGFRAGKKLNIKSSMLVPKGYIFRTEQGNMSGKENFLARYKDLNINEEPQQLSLFDSFQENPKDSLIITDVFNTAQKAKEINGIDTLRHPDPITGMHFGNPFTHLERQKDTIKMPTVKDSVVAFEEWLRGTNYQYVQPERRQWILNQLETGVLVGKPLVYYTTKVPDNSYGQVWYNPETAPNHAHILQKLIQEYADKLAYTPKNDKELKLRDFLRYASGSDQLFIQFIGKDSDAKRQVKRLLQLWQQRQTELLHFGYSFGNVLKLENGYDFDNYFKSKDNLFKEITLNTASQFTPITNYQITEAEAILPRIYESNFKLGKHNLNEIDQNFFKKVNPYYKSAVKDTDFLVRLHDGKFNISIEKNLQNLSKYGTAIKVILSEDGFRLDSDGNKLYKLPNNSAVYQDQYGNETVVLQISDIVLEEFQTLLATTKNIVSVQPFANNLRDLDLTKQLISKSLNANVIKTFNRSIRDIINTAENQRDLIVRLNELYENPESKYRYQQDLSSELYNSFVKSLKIISARIPTQAFQSFMAMNVAAFTGSEGNDVFVTRWQFWLQGSDMDIDKAYMMGINLNSLGMINHWSPLYDYSSTKLANLSDELPVPSKLELIFKDRYNPTKPGIDQISINITTENNLLVDNILSYYSSFQDKNKELRMRSIINILNYLNENKSFEVTQLIYDNPLFEQLINTLNRHNLYKLTNEASQNIIARNIRKVSTDSRNMISAYSPIDRAMALFTDKLKQSYKGRDYKDLYDGFSKYEIQESNSDGKQTVGIMANGIKVFFALTQYFNQYYRNNKDNLSKNNPSYFLRKLTINGKERYASTIADSKLEEIELEFFKKALLETIPEEVQKGTQIMHTTDDASLVISSLISLATDNAKELALAKMNATIDLASMHIFLAILGFNAEDIVDYTTSPVFRELAYLLKKNIFLNQKASIDNKMWKSIRTYCVNNKIPVEELTQLKQIYESAQELKTFASLLGINQGVKNDLQKASDYINKFSSVLSSRLNILSQDDKLDSKPNIIDFNQNKIINSTESILRLAFIRGIKNPSPDWIENTFNKINTLNDKIKEFGIKLTDRVDMQRYFSDEDYKQLIVDLYDLVKMNFNTYDIINHSPNFYNMIKAFSLSIEKLTSLSAKAKLVLKDGYDLYNSNLVINEDYPDGDIEHPVKLFDVDKEYNSKLMRRAQRFVDDYIISDFLQSDFIKNNYKINVVTSGSASKTYDIDFQTNNVLIDFKELMNYIVIPKLKTLYPNNSFLNSLVLKDLNKRRGDKDVRWVFKFNVDRLNSNYDILKYNDIVGGFNQLSDLNITLQQILGDENISINSGKDIKFQDLLYLYNTILNLDNFGQNSLSLLFDKYISEGNSESLPIQLINHFVKFDNKEKEIIADPHAFMFFLLRRTSRSHEINFRDGKKAFDKNTILANLDSITINNKSYINSNIFLNAMRNKILTVENITCE